jgi:hypothetical protein
LAQRKWIRLLALSKSATTTSPKAFGRPLAASLEPTTGTDRLAVLVQVGITLVDDTEGNRHIPTGVVGRHDPAGAMGEHDHEEHQEGLDPPAPTNSGDP